MISRCMDCNDTIESGTYYGTKIKCSSCHAAYRFCRESVPGWNGLSQTDKRRYILANKGKGGRGKKRELVSIQAVSVDDYHAQGGEAMFLNEIRYKKKLKKWYNFSDQKAEESWQAAVRDPKASWIACVIWGGVSAADARTTCAAVLEIQQPFFHPR